MPRTQRTSRGSHVVVNLVGAAIVCGLLLTPGTQRLARVGSDYADTHPAVIWPLLAGLAVFVGIAIGVQAWQGFTVSAALGAIAGGALFLGLYAPARYALPYFGPDTASCPVHQVAQPDGTCAPAKAAKPAKAKGDRR